MHVTEEFDATLEPASRELIERVRVFARERIAPYCTDWEMARVFPREVLRDACREGFASVEVPTRHGCPGLPFSAKLRMVEEIARHDFSFAFSLVNQHNAASRIADHGSEAACRRYLPGLLAGDLIGCTGMTEPGAGSDFAAIDTRAQRVAGGWRLSGEKRWIVNAVQADVCLVFAQTDPGSRDRGIACFIVEADSPGFERGPALPAAGVHASGTGGWRLHDCFVPDECLLYPPGQAFRAAMQSVNKARAHIPAANAAMIESSLLAAIAHARTRQAFGRPVLSHQGLRWSLADVALTLDALRLLTYRAARLIDRGEDAQEAAAMAKKFAGERTVEAIAACIQAMGAEGLLESRGLTRHLAAAKASCFTDGTIEVMNDRVGRLLEARLDRA